MLMSDVSSAQKNFCVQEKARVNGPGKGYLATCQGERVVRRGGI